MTESTAKVRCAGVEARIMAFVFDTVILMAFASVFVVIGLFQLLARSDWGKNDPPDSAFYLAFWIIIAIIPFWLAFNVWLHVWRGQSVGQYIVGIWVQRSDGRALSVADALRRIIVLNPLLFHPLLAVPWILLAVYGTSVTYNVLVLIVAGTLGLLSMLAPLVALIAMLLDKQRRALHDRIAGTLVVQPS